MKAIIDEDLCTACELCVDICEDVFAMGDDVAIVKGDAIPAGAEDDANEAMESCPAEAIAIQ